MFYLKAFGSRASSFTCHKLNRQQDFLLKVIYFRNFYDHIFDEIRERWGPRKETSKPVNGKRTARGVRMKKIFFMINLLRNICLLYSELFTYNKNVIYTRRLYKHQRQGYRLSTSAPEFCSVLSLSFSADTGIYTILVYKFCCCCCSFFFALQRAVFYTSSGPPCRRDYRVLCVCLSVDNFPSWRSQIPNSFNGDQEEEEYVVKSKILFFFLT